MRAGPLNTRIVVQQQSTTPDDLGQPVLTWATFATLWADVKQSSGMTMIRGDADLSVVRASIRIRYRTDITPAMRVAVGLVIYQIQAVLPDVAKKQYTDLVCQVVQ